MGSKLWASDMIINDYIKPMNTAYQFKDYQSACSFLHQLNQFFCGFGVGVDDLENPPKIIQSVAHDLKQRAKQTPKYVQECKTWFEDNAPIVTKCMGIYVRQVLNEIQDERGTG